MYFKESVAFCLFWSWSLFVLFCYVFCFVFWLEEEVVSQVVRRKKNWERVFYEVWPLFEDFRRVF